MIDRGIRRRLLGTAIHALLDAGDAVMGVYNRPISGDYVSPRPIDEANFLAQDIIKEALGHTRIPILSEEGRAIAYGERRSWEMFWLVDPLDGRVEFINRENEFTINIALMDCGRAVLSGVYVPYLRRLYFAEVGGGAYRCDDIGEARVDVSELERQGWMLPLVGDGHMLPRVAVTRSHRTIDTENHIEELRGRNGDLEVVVQGSSYKFCMLAEGVVDYYARFSGTYEWDTAAGELILAEAGGTTLSLDGGQPLIYNKELLDNPWFVCRGAHCTIK